jgi:hypothetical protein
LSLVLPLKLDQFSSVQNDFTSNDVAANVSEKAFLAFLSKQHWLQAARLIDSEHLSILYQQSCEATFPQQWDRFF